MTRVVLVDGTPGTPGAQRKRGGGLRGGIPLRVHPLLQYTRTQREPADSWVIGHCKIGFPASFEHRVCRLREQRLLQQSVNLIT